MIDLFFLLELSYLPFHYYLSLPEENTLVVQRGRFSNWDREAIRVMWKRIKGNYLSSQVRSSKVK